MLLLCFGCKPSNKAITDYRYFDKNIDSLNKVILDLKEPTIQKHDLLSIQVSSASLDQTQVEVFNLLGTGGGAGGEGYLVDYDGTISMPIIGKVQAAGFTKNQLNDTLIARLAPYVKNPVLNIRYTTFRVLLMGEVGQKGWITFPNEKATIVDAIGQGGGISEQGMRDSILLIRQNPNGTIETHRLNMNDAMVFQSPYFQLQQNDIIYALPNNSKLIQYERSNSPFFRDLPVYMGLLASILAFATLIISLVK